MAGTMTGKSDVDEVRGTAVDDGREWEAEAWINRAVDAGEGVVDATLERRKSLVGSTCAFDEKTFDELAFHNDSPSGLRRVGSAGE
jgi:hypothetical protein